LNFEYDVRIDFVGKRDFDAPVFVGTTAVEDDGCREQL